MGRRRVPKSEQLWALPDTPPDTESLECWFGLWAQVPDSLPTVPADAGQAREELLPSLSSCTGLEILERPGQVLGVQVMFAIRKRLWRSPASSEQPGRCPCILSGYLKLDDF